MQYQKYVEPRKKKKEWWSDGYDLKISMVINANKKHPYFFYTWFNEHKNQASKHKKT
jgi:hypothetical protein